MKSRAEISIFIGKGVVALIAIAALLIPAGPALAALADDRLQFIDAWDAARKGDRKQFDQSRQGLEHYTLFPYLQYEHYRHNRRSVAVAEMADFLDQHQDWAFANGLRVAWLKSLGRAGRWAALLQHSHARDTTEIQCYRARAKIQTGQIDGLMAEIQSLWTRGTSMPDECDPAFDWLRSKNGITPGLAWERVRLAMMAGNARFTLYLARFVPAQERIWLERWQTLNRRGYRNLAQARHWDDNRFAQMVTSVSLQRLAKQDAARAWVAYNELKDHMSWSQQQHNSVLREMALQAAVALDPAALTIMGALPAEVLDEQILEWWARAALAAKQWAELESVISRMQPATKSDGRWRYWLAVAHEQRGDFERAADIRQSLSLESTYYGFLAADRLNQPYSICPLEPSVRDEQIQRLRQQPGIARALELRIVDLENWALSEWALAVAGLETDDLRGVAALARVEEWHDRVIFALGNSGDRAWYDWRFPVLWEQPVASAAKLHKLDAAWVHGIMRSESAMAPGARSSAGALGLMQLTPDTAKRLSRQHGVRYRGRSQLLEVEANIGFGTLFMRELLDRYDQNPVLVAGAYNAGPGAVDRWLKSRPRGAADVWIETIPYFETRDYIPRVLAFTAIYDWRLDQPVTRISSRMPALDSGTIGSQATTEVVCQVSGS